MININLLPEELRPQPRSPLPYLMAIVLALVVVLYCTVSFVTQFSQKKTLEERAEKFDQQADRRCA